MYTRREGSFARRVRFSRRGAWPARRMVGRLCEYIIGQRIASGLVEKGSMVACIWMRMLLLNVLMGEHGGIGKISSAEECVSRAGDGRINTCSESHSVCFIKLTLLK